MTKQEIRNLLHELGFESDLLKSVYSKIYPHCKRTLSVDVDNEKINYDKIGIELGDKTTSNYSQDENFVVLECVNRLLEKGYEPEHLTLERRWQVGHGASGGKADINVFSREGKTLFIIECKCWGKEYDRFKQKMLNDGAQLFSYLQQDKNTRFICLYASRLENNKIEYVNSIIPIKDREETLRLLDEGEEVKTYREAKTKEEHYEVWKENFNCYFAPNGIFDDEVQAYNPELIPIKRKDLKGFSEDEGRKFYYQFLEILRHNNISDKSNAFNRIMSLILCKIVDERKDENEITDFQIIEGKDTPEKIQERLQNLYAKGMKEFLREDIVNYTEKDIDDIVSRFPRQKAQKEIKKILRALKFYSNNEFAFKEVHNEKLFLENAKVLNEILTLLQYKKFRYSYSDNGDAKFQKQYLGNFFELLLDSGYKQNEGQYFTPVPIAKFIVWCLPIKEIIKKNLKAGKVKFLPFVLDYACGSGHFLTEVIEEIQHTIHELNLEPTYKEEVNEEIKRIHIGTQWTGDYIYGVEKDYRLARTSKVAMFMHGDGEANIIFGDGLEDYNDINKKLAPSYDIIVANPPYSIHGFKPHMKNLAGKYSLFEILTDNSSEIEVLFVERTAQLLHKDGFAGIVLPSSILTNKDALLYRKTREIIFQNFEIKAVVECGSETFLATTTNTVILFLKRRDDRWKEDYRYVAEDFILHNKKRIDDFADTESMFQKYVENLELNFDDYKTLVARKPNDKLKATEWFTDYQNWFDGLNEIIILKKTNVFLKLKPEERKEKLEKLYHEKVLSIESEKFYYFLLTYNQDVLVIKTGTDKEEQKIFLGYEKRGGKKDAGLAMNLVDGRHITQLYDELDKRNSEKANEFIYRQLLNKPITNINDELTKHINYVSLSDCLNFKNIDFDKHVNTSAKSIINFKSNYPLTALSDLTTSSSGVTFDKSNQSFTPTSKIILTASNINLERKKLALDSLIYLNESFPLDNIYKLKKNDIFICTSSGSISHLGKSIFINKNLEYYFGGFCGVLRGEDGLIQKYISIILAHSLEYKSFISQFSGMNINNLRLTELMKFKIPVPQKKTIEKLVAEFLKSENEENTVINEVTTLKQKSQSLISDLKGEKIKIKQVSEINPSRPTELKDLPDTTEVSFYEMAAVKNEGGFNFHAARKLGQVRKGFTAFKNRDVIWAKITPCMENGKCALVSNLKNDFGFGSTEFHVIRADIEKVLPEIIYHIVKQKWFRQQAEQVMTGSSGHRRVPASFVEEYEISLPTLKEQEKLVKQLIDLESKISKLEEKLSKIPEEKENILNKYL